jgi:ferric-dicitrate binding protein FerR (iron transport regulator)
MTEKEMILLNLLERFAARQLTTQELDELFEFIRQEAYDDMVSSFLIRQIGQSIPEDSNEIGYWQNQFAGFTEKVTEGSAQAVSATEGSEVPANGDKPTPVLPFFRRRLVRYAAAVLLLVGGYLLTTVLRDKNKPAGEPENIVRQNLIQPGGDKAILTLADGSTLVLDSVATGSLTTQGNTAIVKNDKGELVYREGNTTAHTKPVFNTMTTPRGGQFRLHLPDGTRVWLNAASSITYPVAFTEKHRTVTVSGEVYFEVARDKSRPFQVTADGVAIAVLGTNFNINSYKEEGTVKTTLLQGSISVSKQQSGAVVLKPGQQAVANVSGNNDIVVIPRADLEKVMAWKNGLFNFEGSGLKEVMRQLERWYNIDVEYGPNVKDMKFFGQIQRSTSLEDVLKGLQEMKLNFKVEGRKLIVQ